MDENQQKLLVLNLIVKQGKSHAEIAEFLGLDEDTVKVYASEALAELSGVGSTKVSEVAPSKKSSKQTVSSPKATVDTSSDTAEKASNKPASKTGGAVLLAVLGVVALLIATLVLRNDDKPATSQASSNSTAATASTDTATTEPTVVSRFDLKSTTSSSKASGVAEVAEVKGELALLLAGENLNPSSKNDAYAVWLYNSKSDAKRLGFAPPVDKSGALSGIASLPKDAAKYKQVLITLETESSPKSPGTTVLEGQLKLN